MPYHSSIIQYEIKDLMALKIKQTNQTIGQILCNSKCLTRDSKFVTYTGMRLSICTEIHKEVLHHCISDGNEGVFSPQRYYTQHNILKNEQTFYLTFITLNLSKIFCKSLSMHTVNTYHSSFGESNKFFIH